MLNLVVRRETARLLKVKVQSYGTRDLHFSIKGQKLINALAHVITQPERSE
jgi:hypothetical protein